MRYGSTPLSPPSTGGGGGVLRKYDYACMAAAALAYLVLHQAYSVGFVSFDDRVRKFLKPSSQRSHLKEIVHEMNHGATREKTRMAPLFRAGVIAHFRLPELPRPYRTGNPRFADFA